MKFKFLYFIIPGIGLGGLAFISFIAYQSIEVFTAFKQKELLKDISLQIRKSTPQISNIKTDWISWFNNNSLIATSKFGVIMQDINGKIITMHGGYNPVIDLTQVSQLLSIKKQESFHDEFIINNDIRYIWYRSEIYETPYSLLLVHASPSEGISFYYKHLGIPIIIASGFVLWASIWLAIMLVNLYKRLEKQKTLMEHDALHDPLTGLANRTLLTDRLNHALKEAKRDTKSLAICMLDLDRFKEINDALGHSYGDKLLIEVAKRITRIIRDIDTVARIGGDEFAILLQHTDTKNATLIAERISSSLKTEFIIDSERFHISGSLGISFYPDHGTKPEILMKHADLTMYHAKHFNYEFSIYNPEQKIKTNNTLFLYTDLVEAVNKNELEIHYQPKLDIKQNKVMGLEALLRWNHPSRGIIPPDSFIPLAEQTGVIREISRWVLKNAMQDQAYLTSMGIDLTIAINLSAHDLDDISIYDYINSLTETLSLNPEKIILEITESAMMIDPSSTDKILSKLNDKGFIISIDDFGTGYSSLRNLQRMHVKEIKIDRSFVSDMDHNENNARIVRGTIRLAHDLDIKVVAEGVESKAVIKALQTLGCDMIQGYEICKPIHLEKLISKYWKQSA